MKISEMTNNQATNALLRLSGPFANICDDDEMTSIMDAIEAMRSDEGVKITKAIGNIIPRFIVFAFQKHKTDLYDIVGALIDKSNAEVGDMRLVDTIAVVKDSYDEILASFFTPSAKAVKVNEAE